jgi:DNA-binding CsgD family transcriptional regulator
MYLSISSHSPLVRFTDSTVRRAVPHVVRGLDGRTVKRTNQSWSGPTGDLLVELGRLVQADWVTYCELDRVRRRMLGTVSRTGDEYDPDEHDEALFWAVVVNEHPVCVRHQLGDFAALKLSDFVSRRQLHGSRLYDVWFRPGGIEHEPREREVLSWVARGKTNAEVARLLWLAPSTVRKHLENVYAKLGVSTRTAAAARFLGLIGAEAS